MKLAKDLLLALSTVIAFFLGYVAVHQHGTIKYMKAVLERNVMVQPDDYLSESVAEAYARGYHAATEDVGCPPDLATRNMAVESWKKQSGFSKIDFDKAQEDIAVRIREALEGPAKKEGK